MGGGQIFAASVGLPLVPVLGLDRGESGKPSAARRCSDQRDLLQSASRFVLFKSGKCVGAKSSAWQFLDGADELLVGWVGVDAGREDRAVTGEALGETDVLGSTVEVRACGVA